MNRAAALYLAAIALMAALLAALWWAPGPLAGWRHWQVPAPQPPRLDDVQSALLHANPAAAAADPAVLARPLFEPARRPPATAPTAAASAPPAAPNAIEQLRLQGVVAGPALSGIMVDEGGQSRFVRVGETVGDWTLQSVRDRQAVFTRRGQQRTLDWPAADATPAAAGKGAPAAAPHNRAAARAPAPLSSTGGARAPAPVPAPAAVAPPTPAKANTAAPAAPADAAPPRRGSFGGGAARPPPPR